MVEISDELAVSLKDESFRLGHVFIKRRHSNAQAYVHPKSIPETVIRNKGMRQR